MRRRRWKENREEMEKCWMVNGVEVPCNVYNTHIYTDTVNVGYDDDDDDGVADYIRIIASGIRVSTLRTFY